MTNILKIWHKSAGNSCIFLAQTSFYPYLKRTHPAICKELNIFHNIKQITMEFFSPNILQPNVFLFLGWTIPSNMVYKSGLQDECEEWKACWFHSASSLSPFFCTVIQNNLNSLLYKEKLLFIVCLFFGDWFKATVFDRKKKPVCYKRDLCENTGMLKLFSGLSHVFIY